MTSMSYLLGSGIFICIFFHLCSREDLPSSLYFLYFLKKKISPQNSIRENFMKSSEEVTLHNTQLKE